MGCGRSRRLRCRRPLVGGGGGDDDGDGDGSGGGGGGGGGGGDGGVGGRDLQSVFVVVIATMMLHTVDAGLCNLSTVTETATCPRQHWQLNSWILLLSCQYES